ncbi:MAG: PilZ domain-containing protein [Novosphingobium sp.]
MVQVFCAIPEARSHTLELSNGECFETEPIWIDENHAGLRFRNPIELSVLLAQSAGKFPKRQLRVRTQVGANVVVGDQCYAAAIENISQQGAGLTCDTHFAINQLVRLETGIVAPLYAKVRWRNTPDYGLIFERVLEFEEMGRFAATSTRSADLKAVCMVA